MQPEPNQTETTLDDAATALVGTIVAERYRVEALLGSGAMGTVYRATHVHTRKPVALKVLHREMTTVEEVVLRFEREAIAAARVEHLNVAGATDFGRLEDGSFYLVLEYVAGQSLRSILGNGPVLLERALDIARQIAHGLAAAHEAGVVHRDLKPDNIMLVQRDSAELVKVLDFGVAKLTDGDSSGRALTRIGTIMGTPIYMSPEQALGHTVDHRTDLYALGTIVYEMLAGRPPFHGDEVAQLLMQQVSAPPPPLPDSIPSDVRALVEWTLKKDPEARPAGANALAAELDAVLDRIARSDTAPMFPQGDSTPQEAAAEAAALAGAAEPAVGQAPEQPITEPMSSAGAEASPDRNGDATGQSAGAPAAAAHEPGSVPATSAVGPQAAFAPIAPMSAVAPVAAWSEPAHKRWPPLWLWLAAASFGLASVAVIGLLLWSPFEGVSRLYAPHVAGHLASFSRSAAERIRRAQRTHAIKSSAVETSVASPTAPAASAQPVSPPVAEPAPADSKTRSDSKKPSGKKQEKRKTGPGGIYIPPPSEWF